MKNIIGLLDTISETARIRLSNPLMGSFVMSWIPVNWRIVSILLFSEKEIEEKISHIEANYLDIQFLFLYPLFFAAFYVIVLPYIGAGIESLLRGINRYRKRLRMEDDLEDIRQKQVLAAEEWQLTKIRGGDTDRVRQLNERLDRLEHTVQTEHEEQDQSAPARPKNARRNPKKSTPPKRTKEQATPPDQRPSPNPSPSMKDLVIRDLPKTEREWITVYAFLVSNHGKEPFTRDQIIQKYEESNRKTDSRMANLTNNLNNIVKSSQIKYINDNEMILTAPGVEIAEEVLSR